MLELYPQLKERRAPGLGSGRKGWTVPGSLAFQRLYEELKVERVVAVLGRPDVRPGTRRRLVEEVPMASYALVDRLLAESARLEGEDPERSAELSRRILT